MKADKDSDPFESRRVYQKQKVYQRCLYDSLYQLLDLIKVNKDDRLNISNLLYQFTSKQIEAEFTDTQKEYRQEMYKYLTQKNGQGKEVIFMKDLILRNSPKLSGDGNLSLHRQNVHDKLHRSTNYRGVSKNGRCNWQILTMIDGEKFYVGTVDDMNKAAIIYDVLSIQTKGRKAKTNFSYSKNELLAILQLKKMSNIKERYENERESGSAVAEQNSQNSAKKDLNQIRRK